MLNAEGRLEANDDRVIIPVEAQGVKLVSTGLIVETEETALMWRGLMLSKALEQFLNQVEWGELDYLVIDMPPGTGDIQMALTRLLPQAEMVVVTTPQKTAQKVAVRVADMARRSFMPVVGRHREHGRLHVCPRRDLCALRFRRRPGAGRFARACHSSPPSLSTPRWFAAATTVSPWCAPFPDNPASVAFRTDRRSDRRTGAACRGRDLYGPHRQVGRCAGRPGPPGSHGARRR